MTRVRCLAALVAATICAAPWNVIAQSRTPSASGTTGAQSARGTTGVLIIAHGADAGWNARVDSLASSLRRDGGFAGPVAVSFLMGPAAATSRFQDAVDSLVHSGARRVLVVPVLVSSHSGHYEQVRYLAGQTDTLDEEMMHLSTCRASRARARAFQSW